MRSQHPVPTRRRAPCRWLRLLAALAALGLAACERVADKPPPISGAPAAVPPLMWSGHGPAA